MAAGLDSRLVTLGRVTLLGADGAEDRELATRKRKLVLLTLLAVSRRPWSRDALVDLFWGEQPEERARHSLSDALSHLRRVLGPDAITQRRSEVELGESLKLSVDVLELQAAAQAKRHDAVVALFEGPFLSGVHAGGSPRLEQWIDGERLRIDALFATAAKSECERLARAQEFDACATLAQRWLAVAPTSPHAAIFRLRGIAADASPESDQRALDEFARLERRLDTEYGVRPDRTVVAVADEIAQRVRERQAAPKTIQHAATPAATEFAAPPEPPAAPPASVAMPSPVLPPSHAAQPTRTPAIGKPRSVWWLGAALASVITIAVYLRTGAQPIPANAATTAPAAQAVLTDSPVAKRLYVRAAEIYRRDGNREEAARLLDSAIAIDSGFAMAYRLLGTIYDNGVDARSKVVEMLTLAATHADRLPAQERLLTLGRYHTTVTSDYAKAASAYRALLDLSPNDARAWSNLGAVYDYLGDRQRAVDAYDRSLRLNPKAAITWMNLSDGRYVLGDVAGAWRALDSLALMFPGHPGLFMRTAALAHGEENRELAESQLHALIRSAPDNLYLQSAGEMLLAKALWSWGRVADGDAARERSIALDRKRGALESALVGEIDLAMSAVWLRADSGAARRRIAAALRRTPLATLAVVDRPYLDLSIALASAGDVRGASAALQDYVAATDSADRLRALPREHHARGMLALVAGRFPDAVREFAQVPDALCGICGLPELGLALERSGAADSARAVYARYAGTPSQRRLDMTDAFHGTRIRAALMTPGVPVPK